ncbi:MAG: phenylalanine--tRNA ligase subunit beta [Candidatus Nitricoxidivorans perseverans]|uniref:Phenylalanine--tRNA ligase beta subunit n=1 Tax=Candidatus Nitricoxidivorans perseverans TaxID=2975601 RepID=A0AA49FLE7_9PROT|nr:MAG: phenylalanine--tRNA ligase subunit beta [Candidatus Nitricoxidivorans perseverans]
MKFPESWLRALVNPPLSTDELCHLLTMAGLEVEETQCVDGDVLITLKLTPNRADCLSLSGIAREVAALTGAPLALPAIDAVPAAHGETRAVALDAPGACPRYCGRIVRGVNARAATPDWMRRRIEGCGVRPISALVDITNYVMLELGQPLHAFDDAELAGAIRVRYPKDGEQLLLLNEQTVTPATDTALIADDGKPLALAGIMGGQDSGVGDATADLFLESAFFAPAAIAGRARALGFSSDASHRFERGVDFELQRRAIERATRLIIDICGGRPGPVVEAASPDHLPARKPVRLRPARAAKVLGIDLSPEQIGGLLQGLGTGCERNGEDFIITPPSHRFDMEIEEDLIEEIARLHGYDNIPAPPPKARLAMLPLPEDRRGPMQVRRLLAERGYFEVVTMSFVEAAWESDFAGNDAPVRLANPIASQAGVMRSTLIGGLVGVLAANRKRQLDRVRVFEVGRVFTRDAGGQPVAGFRQPLRVGALWAGPALPEQWGTPTRNADFFDAKGDLEVLLGVSQRLTFAKVAHPALHPGRAARVMLDGREIGVVGELHPRWVQQYELGSTPAVFEIDLEALLAAAMPAYREASRFPAVIRDLALMVPQHQAFQPVLDALRAAAPALVRDIGLFDVYQGKGLPEGQKSLAFRIVMQDTERTLADAEVDAAVTRLIDAAVGHCGATLRG